MAGFCFSRSGRSFLLVALAALLATAGTACSQRDPQFKDAAGKALIPSVTGPSFSALGLSEGAAHWVTLSNGAEIRVSKNDGRLWMEVQGILTAQAFEALVSRAGGSADARKREFSKSLRLLEERGATILDTYEDIGLFSGFVPYEPKLFERFEGLELPYRLVLNPTVHDRAALDDSRSRKLSAEGLSVSRTSNEAFSGLARMGVLEFVRQVEGELTGGVRVDGSSVRVGITDTGITYNHPTFLSAKDPSRNRIFHMRDFTREGRVYFNPSARFSVAPGATSPDHLLLTGEVILTPGLPASPLGDEFSLIQGREILPSAELRAALLNSEVTVKLGILRESVFQSASDEVDFNQNGKLDDDVLVLFVHENGQEDRLYVDWNGSGDFSRTRALRDFNATGDLASVFSEKIGFDLRTETLPARRGGKTSVISASIIGYDPGNHGSHVAGIAVGSRTLSNDRSDTLARGTAPEAQIAMNRVCANQTGCNALNAVVDLVLKAGADVVNLSLGGLNPFNDGYGVEELTYNRLTQVKSALFMISAGNSGPTAQTVGSPSTARLALSIGATATRDLIERQYQNPGTGTGMEEPDFLLFFSSRGPSAAGGFKPNLSAPGTELSSIQLNAAPGARAGLDVYWGTSMAAPAATGAYALLLDAIRKYNLQNPAAPLPSDALTLRAVLLESARPFDVATFEPATGATRDGQYTWVDQGTGMISLPAAWNHLRKLARTPATSELELDYPIYTTQNASDSPSGNAYDGTRVGEQGEPEFGTGLYLSYTGTETLRQVHLGRRLTEGAIAKAQDLAALNRTLVTSADVFELRTVIHGSRIEWLRAGTLNALDCWNTPTGDLTLLGRGAEVAVTEQGGVLNPSPASSLSVCLNRRAIEEELPPGDHGALIYGYRKKGDITSPVASFIVPVSLKVPHRVLENKTGYQISGTVKSFGVKRHTVRVPEGVSVVRVSLEVPMARTQGRGRLADGESCSGVELMATLGKNIRKPFRTRSEARVANCDGEGRPNPSGGRRRIEFTVDRPAGGTWDLHVFGQNKFRDSQYLLTVDYVVARTSVTEIRGDLSALQGSFRWTLLDASRETAPSAEHSTLELDGLRKTTQNGLDQGQILWAPAVQGGVFRTWDASRVRQATIRIEGRVEGRTATGNDADLAVVACPLTALQPMDPACSVVGVSATDSDREEVAFRPAPGKKYAVRIEGYAIRDTDYSVALEETATFAAERGQLSLMGSLPELEVRHSFAPQAGSLLESPEYTQQGHSLVGRIVLRDSAKVVLSTLPLELLPNTLDF
jgi:subtilisin family serine protease